MTGFTAVLGVTILLGPMPQQAPPRDPARPGLLASDGTAVEAALQKQIAGAPADVARYLELAKLQEYRGAVKEAEATLLRAREAVPGDHAVPESLAYLYSRAGDSDKAIAMLELAAALEPASAQAQHRVAAFYWEKATHDHRLLPAEQFADITAGLAASDRALAIDPDYVDALVYKGLLLRQRASHEADPAQKQQTIARAIELQARAIEIRRTSPAVSADSRTVAGNPSPPPPPLSMAPVRVGGNIRTPTKIRDVRPVYPQDAMNAAISGIVILEATLGLDGHVIGAKILRSIPQLDQAAIDAVTQWQFTPTELNGQPVPVVMTVTVNFTLE